MVKNFKSSISVVFSLLLVLLLSSCAGGGAAGLNSYQSPDGRYGFLYPTGWTRVAVTGGPKVVYHDLINSDETLSLVVSEVGNDIDLQEIGTPEEVGLRLMNEVIAPEGSGRNVDLINASDRDSDNHTFYDLEYVVHLEDRDRHELATVVVDRGSLYTFATGTNEIRWPKVKNLFGKVVTSFKFLI
tara:strand:- start:1026 stop:1583 length:558 start_codon:yes stop_codon:yes gene_type:complete